LGTKYNLVAKAKPCGYQDMLANYPARIIHRDDTDAEARRVVPELPKNVRKSGRMAPDCTK
jgi:hypothetical protein